MKVVTAPNNFEEKPYYTKKVFVAGGISNCPDWQSELLELIDFPLKSFDKVIFYNPRRENFDVSDPNASDAQITWEHEKILESEIILFYFPAETLCPITLFELGKVLYTGKKIFVACHPAYQRRYDVVKQLSLVRPEIHVGESLEDLKTDIVEYFIYY